MSRLTILELKTDAMKFSAGHFMMHDATRRETMHGHDYQVSVRLLTRIIQNGMSFDVRDFKKLVANLCKSLDYRFILPAQSDFIRLEETESHWLAKLQEESISFLKRDAVVLPICNSTLEELSHWFVQQLTQDQAALEQQHIEGLSITIGNGRGESATTAWGALTPACP